MRLDNSDPMARFGDFKKHDCSADWETGGIVPKFK